MKRTYRLAAQPARHQGHSIYEFTPGDEPGVDKRGDCVLHMLGVTMPETVSDTLLALQRAYQQGREDRAAEIQEDWLKAFEEYRKSLWGVQPGWGQVDVLAAWHRPGIDYEAMHEARSDEAKLRDHLIGSHGYDPAALAGATYNDLMLVHQRQPDPHRHPETP